MADSIPPSNPDKRPPEEFVIGQAGAFVAAMQINDKYYPVTPTAFQSVRIVSNIHTLVPTLQIVCADPLARLTNEVTNSDTGELAVGDGSKISFAIGADLKGQLLERKFRLISTPKITMSNDAPIISITAAIDNFKWWRGLASGVQQGSSVDAITSLAVDCQLGAHVPHATDDEMPWLPHHMSNSQFANYIALHGWGSEESCMIGGMDVDRVYRYVDVSQLANEKPTFKVCYLKPLGEKDINVQEIKIYTSGAENLFNVYNARMSGEKVDGERFEYEDTDVIKHGNFLDLNKDVKSDIGLVRSRMMPIDAGNTHTNFAKARYQNERIAQTFKINVDIYIEEESGMGLFDVVQLDMADHVAGGDQLNYSGVYFVTARVYGLNGGSYFEKIRLSTNSRHINAVGKMT